MIACLERYKVVYLMDIINVLFRCKAKKIEENPTKY